MQSFDCMHSCMHIFDNALAANFSCIQFANIFHPITCMCFARFPAFKARARVSLPWSIHIYTFAQVYRVTRRCHAFGVAVRTAQRCLGHYRRLWTRQGWIWCRVHQQEKKSSTFFGGKCIRAKKTKSNKNKSSTFFCTFGGFRYSVCLWDMNSEKTSLTC